MKRNRHGRIVGQLQHYVVAVEAGMIFERLRAVDHRKTISQTFGFLAELCRHLCTSMRRRIKHPVLEDISSIDRMQAAAKGDVLRCLCFKQGVSADKVVVESSLGVTLVEGMMLHQPF